MKNALIILTLAALFTALTPVGGGAMEGGAMEKTSFSIKTPAFEDKGAVPRQHTCDGADISPEIKWQGAPQGTKSFILIMDDPDAPAGLFTHWIAYDIQASEIGLGKDVSKKASVNGTLKQGLNDFGRVGYGGPCPPREHGPHRYFFRLMALDVRTIEVKAGAPKKEVEGAAKGHVLAEASFMRTYEQP